jgi:hypothetical protein
MGRSRLVAVLHEESWNRSDDLGHSNLTRQVTMLGGWSTAEGRVKTADRAALQPTELRPLLLFMRLECFRLLFATHILGWENFTCGLHLRCFRFTGVTTY